MKTLCVFNDETLFFLQYWQYRYCKVPPRENPAKHFLKRLQEQTKPTIPLLERQTIYCSITYIYIYIDIDIDIHRYRYRYRCTYAHRVSQVSMNSRFLLKRSIFSRAAGGLATQVPTLHSAWARLVAFVQYCALNSRCFCRFPKIGLFIPFGHVSPIYIHVYSSDFITLPHAMRYQDSPRSRSGSKAEQVIHRIVPSMPGESHSASLAMATVKLGGSAVSLSLWPFNGRFEMVFMGKKKQSPMDFRPQ